MAQPFPKHPNLTGGFAPIQMECDVRDVVVVGEIAEVVVVVEVAELAVVRRHVTKCAGVPAERQHRRGGQAARHAP